MKDKLEVKRNTIINKKINIVNKVPKIKEHQIMEIKKYIYKDIL